MGEGVAEGVEFGGAASFQLGGDGVGFGGLAGFAEKGFPEAVKVGRWEAVAVAFGGLLDVGQGGGRIAPAVGQAGEVVGSRGVVGVDGFEMVKDGFGSIVAPCLSQHVSPDDLR